MRGFRFTAAALFFCASAFAQNSFDDLIQLVRQNDLATLKTRLAKGASADTADVRGTTLLIHAAAIGSPEAVKLLLDSGANPNAKNQLDETALLLGAMDARKVAMLLAKDADPNAVSKLGRTPLIVAAACDGCTAAVKLLLDKGADPKARTKMGMSALNAAADTGDFETVKLLASKGADAVAADGAGNTPIAGAAQNCRLDELKYFLSKGANVNEASKFGGEVKFGKIQLINLTPLMLASTFCSAEVVQTLLDAKANVNDRDIRGMTPLMFAVSSESPRPAVVKLLIKAGADVNAKSTTGETALDWARKFGYPEIVSTLTAAGASEGLPYTKPALKLAANRTVPLAAEKATAILQQGATEFFKQSGCVGCHHQPAASVAGAAARKAGIHVDEGAAQSYIKMVEGEAAFFQQTLLERGDSGGLTDSPMWKLLALEAEHYKPNLTTDVLVSYIAAFQHANGSWWFGGISRAPFEEGPVARTALNLRLLQTYGTPAMKADFERRIERARDFLAEAKPASNDEMAMQILGLHWAGYNPEKVRALAKTLIATQHADGGFAQNRNLAPDAYATGETLYALHESGVAKPADPVYQKGVKFLLSTQAEDGSWYVRSRAPKFQPYFQSGFPYDHDQWISSTATSWAVRGLSPAAETQKRASR